MRRSSPLAVSILIAACGGGSVGNSDTVSEPEAGAANGVIDSTDSSSSAESTSTISGRVADGYIQGATVCVDLNDNDSCDSDEPSTVTGDGGTYNLDIPADAIDKSIVADIPAEAIDEDTGDAVGKPLVFIAPAEKPEFLSPITTLIHQELRANPALNVDDAERTVKTILGIDEEEDVSLFADYVAEGNESSGNGEKAERFRYLHDTARVVASLMKDIEDQVESAAVSNGIDVTGSVDTQRAIREIVRSEVRDLLPQIARQVAEIVRSEETSEPDSGEAATGFDPDQLAQTLRPVDAGENVENRIDAVRDRVEVVQSDIRQLLTDGVYWMEFDCNYDFDNHDSATVDGETAADAYADEVPADFDYAGDIDYPKPECKAFYGHVQLNASGDSLVSDNYLYDADTGGWTMETEEDDFYRSDYSLVDGQWMSVESSGPEGQVEFTEDGTAVITNAEGRMQLKAVTQDVGGTKVINHFWQDDASPLWFDLVEPAAMFSAGSLAHKISVRQSTHPYRLFNHQPQDEQSQEYCAQYNGNCNVVNAMVEGRQGAVTSLDEIRNTAYLGVDLLVHSAGFDNGGLVKLSAEVPADGTMPTHGRVHWSMGRDGNDYGSGEISRVDNEFDVDAIDAYNTYPAGQDLALECSEDFDPENAPFPDLQPNGLLVEGQASGFSFPDGSDATDDGQGSDDSSGFVTPEEVHTEAERLLEIPDTEFPDGSGLPEKPDCSDLIAKTEIAPGTVDYSDDPTASSENFPGLDGSEPHALVSEWKVIEVDGVKMIEIQMPFLLRQESDGERESAILLVEHDGFVRLGARLPESFIDRVITYNETAFATLQSIVEMGANSER